MAKTTGREGNFFLEIETDSREVAHILAALRFCQKEVSDISLQSLGHFDELDIAPLSDDEVDSLCDRINFGGLEPSEALAVEEKPYSPNLVHCAADVECPHCGVLHKNIEPAEGGAPFEIECEGGCGKKITVSCVWHPTLTADQEEEISS